MVLLALGLTTGSAAQWGWNTYGSSSRHRELAVAGARGASDRAGIADRSGAADRAGVPDAQAAPSTSAASPAVPAPVPSHREATPTASPAGRASRGTGRTAAPRPTATTTARTSIEDQVATLTNAERAKHGCGPLRIDQRLGAAARQHSTDMRQHRYFDHTSPTGVDPWQRARAAGYPQPSAENIARGQQTAKSVVAAWMNSPGHRANILNCDSKAVGVGVETGSGGPWWTEMFGTV